MGGRQRRRSGAGRQLDRQDRVSLPQSRQQDRHFHAACRDPDQHRDSREHLPGRPELSHRRQRPMRRSLAANWAGFYLGGNFGSGTGRDRSSTEPAGDRALRDVQPRARRDQWRRAGGLQLAGGQLGVRSGGRYPGQHPERQQDLHLPVRARRGLRGLRRHAAMVRHGARAAGLFGRVDLVLRDRRSRLRQHQDQDRHERLRRPGDAILLAHQYRLDRGRGHRNAVHAARIAGPELDDQDRVSLRRPRLDVGQLHLRRCSRDGDAFGDRTRLPR